MLCKPLFTIQVRVKGLFKVILQYKTKCLNSKSDAQQDCINAKFQVSVQINEVLCTIKNNKLEINKNLKGSRDHNKSKETSKHNSSW